MAIHQLSTTSMYAYYCTYTYVYLHYTKCKYRILALTCLSFLAF